MGSFRSTPDVQKHSSNGQHGNISYAVSHMCGWRMYMEDADISACPLKDTGCSLFAIFDGHGGPEVSVFVSRCFSEELVKNPNFKTGKYEEALRETFLYMDKMLLNEDGHKKITEIQKEMREKDNCPKYEEESHAGCTANVVLITPDSIICANAGDSRAVACISGGQVEPLSIDHKPEDQKELERITKAGGTINYGRVNGGLNLSRALGDFEYKKRSDLSPEEQMITANPDIKKIKLENVDFIIMGCDGIWEIKSNADMVEWVRNRINSNKESTKILEELLDELVAKDNSSQYGMDNMSSILIQFNKK